MEPPCPPGYAPQRLPESSPLAEIPQQSSCQSFQSLSLSTPLPLRPATRYKRRRRPVAASSRPNPHILSPCGSPVASRSGSPLPQNTSLPASVPNNLPECAWNAITQEISKVEVISRRSRVPVVFGESKAVEFVRHLSLVSTATALEECADALHAWRTGRGQGPSPILQNNLVSLIAQLDNLNPSSFFDVVQLRHLLLSIYSRYDNLKNGRPCEGDHFILNKIRKTAGRKGVGNATKVLQHLLAPGCIPHRTRLPDQNQGFTRHQWNAWQQEGRVYYKLYISFGPGILELVPTSIPRWLFRLPDEVWTVFIKGLSQAFPHIREMAHIMHEGVKTIRSFRNPPQPPLYFESIDFCDSEHPFPPSHLLFRPDLYSTPPPDDDVDLDAAHILAGIPSSS